MSPPPHISVRLSNRALNILYTFSLHISGTRSSLEIGNLLYNIILVLCMLSILMCSGHINPKIQGYRQGSVKVVWQNPLFLAYPLTYITNVTLLNTKNVVKSLNKWFDPNEHHFVSIDLHGFECEEMQITVAVVGAEDQAESITAVVPSCEYG